MNGRPTFRDFRQQLSAYAQSVGSPLGICIGNIPVLAGLVNVATERLIGDPLQPEEGWWGGWAKYVFSVTIGNPYIVAPRGVARLIVMDVVNKPVKIQNGFYEFLDYGQGLQPNPCSQGACDGFTQTYDRDTVPTFAPLNPTAQLIRVFPVDPRDVGKTVIVQGTDQNGNTITSTDPVTNITILGEIITLALPFSTTINQFTPPITGIEKDTTFGPVTFFQVDPNSGTTANLSQMEPSETTAQYRRYLVNNLPCQPTNLNPTGQISVTAQCKLDYQPIFSDSDYLGIPCVPALIAECEAIRYESMDNARAQQMAVAKHGKSISLLFGQLNHYLGNERPAINVPLFGPNKRLARQPI